MAEIVHLPFNDNAFATQAANSANPSQPAIVSLGSFGTHAGRSALHINEGGYAIIPGTDASWLADDFTFTGWIKADQTGNPTETYIYLKFAGVDRELHSPLGTTLAAWTFLSIKQQVTGTVGTLTLLLGTTTILSETYPTGWGMPTGFAVYNDDFTAASGNVALSDVIISTVVDVREQMMGAVSWDDITSRLLRPQMMGAVSWDMPTVITLPPAPPALTDVVTYYINGLRFTDFGVIVSKSPKGILGKPGLKSANAYDWPDQHGEAVDLHAPRFKARTIELECFILADSPADLESKWNDFTEQFHLPGTQRLQINAFTYPTLVFEVYSPEDIELDKKWRKGQMVGTFDLTLVEPDPIKKVLSFVGPGTLNMTMSSTEPINAHFGDGTHSFDIYGQNQVINHTYNTAGTYYVILSGQVDKITSLTHNGVVVWAKI